MSRIVPESRSGETAIAIGGHFTLGVGEKRRWVVRTGSERQTTP